MGIPRTSLKWLLKILTEGLLQDSAVSTPWWLKVKNILLNSILPILGGGVVWTWLKDHWAHALSGGIGVFVVLVYVSSIIRVWRMGKALPMLQPVGPTSQRVLMVPTEIPNGMGIYAPRGETLARGVCTIRDVSITTVEATDRTRHFVLQCTTILHGFDPKVVASPAKLRVTGSGDRDDIVVLETRGRAHATERSHVPGITVYNAVIGIAQLPNLAKAIRREMGEAFKVTMPATQPMYCSIEIRLPFDGADLEMHRASGVKMDFELDNTMKREFLVKIS
jgi:hypothetical protein